MLVSYCSIVEVAQVVILNLCLVSCSSVLKVMHTLASGEY